MQFVKRSDLSQALQPIIRLSELGLFYNTLQLSDRGPVKSVHGHTWREEGAVDLQ